MDLTERPGYLRLKTGKVVKNLFEARNTLTQRTEGPKCSGVISLDLTFMNDGDMQDWQHSVLNRESSLL